MVIDITIPAQSVTVPSQDVIASIPAARVVYQGSWLAQTGAIGNALSPLSLFTFLSTGQYRISVALEVNGTGGIVSVWVWDAYMQGAADLQVISNSPNFIDVSGGKVVSVVASAAQVATLYTTISNSAHLSYYNLYVVIEQLQ